MRRFLSKIKYSDNNFKSISIFYKFIAISICCFIIPLLCITLIFYYNIKNIIEKEVSNSYQQVVEQYVANIDYKTDAYKKLILNISTDNVIHEALTSSQHLNYMDITTTKRVANTINRLCTWLNRTEMTRIELFPVNNIPSDGKFIIDISELDHNILSEYKSLDGLKAKRIYWYNKNKDENSISILKSVMNIYSQSNLDIYGYFKIDLDKRKFFEADNTDMNISNNYLIHIIDESGQIIYQNHNDYDIALKYNLLEKSDGQAFVKNDSYIKVNRKIDIEDWHAVFLFPIDLIKKEIKSSVYLVTYIIFIILVVIALITVKLSKQFSNRLQMLIEKMNRVKTGDFSFDYEIRGNDEITILDSNFNDMVDNVQRLINENYIQKIEKKEAELMALQNQINPHFLYNTLETINSIASVYGSKEILTICQKMGQMMRYNLSSKESLVSITEEMEHVDNYIQIQKIRFGDKIEIKYNIKDGLQDYMMIKFILQPIVENSINHGFKNITYGGCISLVVSYQGGDVIIAIEDNGVGIVDADVKTLNESFSKYNNNQANKKSIGLSNVNARIKLAYGEKYGLRIESIYGKGTTVIILLPGNK